MFRWASFAAGNALNLVSLILSRDLAKYPNKKESENIYTPMFQEMKVPRGSLGLVKEALPDEDPSQMRGEEKARHDYNKRRQVLAMKGSRMEALDWATDTLLKAATDLESNIRKETKYWDEILSISDKGWPLQRTRRGVRNAPYAVKYGPSEGRVQLSIKSSSTDNYQPATNLKRVAWLHYVWTVMATSSLIRLSL